MDVKLKPLSSQDGESLKQIYHWKMDPKTRAFSFSKKKDSLDIFVQNFDSKFCSCQKLAPLWILYQGKRVGLLYFEKWFLDLKAELSLFLDPSYQSLGIGKLALKEGLNRAQKEGFDEIVAFVKKENPRAQRIFSANGFSLQGNVEVPKYGHLYDALKYVWKKQEKEKVFIIAEAGSNFHVGDEKEDLQRAKQLILEAFLAGASAVKFQLYDAKSVYAPHAGAPSYLKEEIHSLFEKFALKGTFVEKLASYAKFLGIEWMCSPFSEKHFKSVDPYVVRHKIASYEIRHLRLLELAGASQKPLILSTGASTEEDIEWALKIFKEAGGQEVTLLHCSAQYPADPKGLNLRALLRLQERFKVPCGYSDHSLHPLYAPLLAVALGAKVIEKHFTLSRQTPGPDHFFALECHELKEMIQGIREAEKMLGLAIKEIFPQEEELAQFTRRGLHALRKIEKGECLEEGKNIAILRSGKQNFGLHPKYLDRVEGQKVQNAIEAGSGIKKSDLIWKEN